VLCLLAHCRIHASAGVRCAVHAFTHAPFSWTAPPEGGAVHALPLAPRTQLACHPRELAAPPAHCRS
jgi:hypothetical protein